MFLCSSQAQLAERAERYDDMMNFMTQAAEMSELDKEERNLLSLAIKHAVGSRRSSVRILKSAKELGEMPAPVVDKYLIKVEKELHDLCRSVVRLLDDIVFPKLSESDKEASVYYLKMKGDYFRQALVDSIAYPFSLFFLLF